jgi:type II secretory pathway pseudopilin PulG
MDIIGTNSTYIIGIVAAIVVWLLSKMGIKNLDKAQIAAILTIILDIIQDIKTNRRQRIWMISARSNGCATGGSCSPQKKRN